MIFTIYKGKTTKEISFPLGGIGSGCIGLGGDGRLIDWEIFNRPSKGRGNGYSHIAIKSKNSKGIITKVLNGDLLKDYMGRYQNGQDGGFGLGPETSSLCGFPHFKDVTFDGEFPIAKIIFKDDMFPADVILTAFNPFIPLDDKNSSIPAAFFEIEIQNNADEATEFQTAFSVKNPFKTTRNTFVKKDGISMLFLDNAGTEKTSTEYGDLTLATDGTTVHYQTYWYRGGWQDGIVSFWNDFTSENDLSDRTYEDYGDRDTGTLAVKIKIMPGIKEKIRFILTWNVPNCYNYWDPFLDESGRDKTWKNYYATIFENSQGSAVYSLKNWDMLFERTEVFKDALYSSTLDKVVIDAISSNLSVLKSPTVLRLDDGSFYGWEGVHPTMGSCEGTCQHVWNYAYALCFLFPKLERSIRNAELKYALEDSGKTSFRVKLPYGRDNGGFRACLDGQMGIIIKTYREWKISGDDKWLKENWEKLKKILEYAWSEDNPDEWDRDKDGILEGRQHHTLDMELFGPSSWLEGMYLAALKAASIMALYLGDLKKHKEYEEIYKKGYEWTKKNLFSGEYFIHKVDIKDKNILEHFGAVREYWNIEKEEIKYQIGPGCSIDQMLGQWHSDIIGIGEIFDKSQIKIALKNMMKNNFKESMREFCNTWRIFSLNDEAGTVICAYPDKSVKPSIAVPYCDETMTGFEYQFAGFLIRYGMINEAIKVVKAIRDRYDGEKRNPWNEIECGSNYARSMASFALMPIFGGFEFDMPRHYMGFNPACQKGDFKCLWSIEPGWGTFEITDGYAKLLVIEGSVKLSSFGAKFAKTVKNVVADGKNIKFHGEDGTIKFDLITINNSLEIFY